MYNIVWIAPNGVKIVGPIVRAKSRTYAQAVAETRPERSRYVGFTVRKLR